VRDPELTRLLLHELERHLRTLEGLADRDASETTRRTAHALKGSAGLAGEPELAAVMQDLERRLRDGDVDAFEETKRAVRSAIDRLSSGERAVAPSGSAWPIPPAELVVHDLDASARPIYIAEIGDRLARIDEVLAREHPGPDAETELYRHIHTMKGAASAASDEPMAWFCHGLEERLRSGRSAIAELSTYRNVLGMLLEDPEAALATLRGVLGRRSQRPDPHHDGDGTIRVSAQAVDRLLDHASGIAAARERVAARVVGAATHGRALGYLRAELAEALRLIGPPRPWGAPSAALRKIEQTSQALARMREELEREAERLKASDQGLKNDTVAVKRLLAAMRQTPIRGLFARVAAAAHAEARRSGRLVTVRMEGADEPLDRRLVELLVEPCLQLARNAIAHGIELPDQRERLGKPREATMTLHAQRRGNRLSISIADDGAGVDVAAVRARAVESGVVTEVLAQAADDQTLLELLFEPGFSMRSQSPDLLAGRGIGLDITLASVQRLGGTIRLSSLYGKGFEARVDVPIESGLVTVLWVSADGVDLAIPTAHALEVARLGPAEGVPHLASCLEPRSVGRAAFTIELDALDGAPRFKVGVDTVGAPEEVLVRALSPTLAGIGPYAGGIVRGDGSVRFVIDVLALAPRARALGRVPEGRISEPPSRRS
jgi:two-component system, chemotaxis family, sensor kinase CheA